MTLSERLLTRKAQAAAQHIAEGGDSESFAKLWQRIEPLELAQVALTPPDQSEKPFQVMTFPEKVALREKVGDAEFARMVQEARS